MGIVARKALRGILRAYDCSDETAALASLWLGRPQRAARHLAAIVASSKRPRTTRRPSMPSRPRLFLFMVRGSSGGWSGRRAHRRVALDGARACLNRGAPAAALAALAALDAEVAPFSSPVRRFASGRRRAAPSGSPSIFDDFARGRSQRPLRRRRRPYSTTSTRRAEPTAPGGRAPSSTAGRSGQRQAAPPTAAAKLDLRRFRAPRPQQAPRSMLDGFDAAPSRPARSRSMLDGFDAAPQQRSAPPSMLDGFDAAPQRRAAGRRHAARARGYANRNTSSTRRRRSRRRRHHHGSARERRAWPWRRPRRSLAARSARVRARQVGGDDA